MHKYRLIMKKGEGTFSEVIKAQAIKNGRMVAIKCMKSQFESEDQVNNLREIQALKRLSPHPNVIKLLEVLFDHATGRLALVFELMDMNIYELIRGRRQYLSEPRVRLFMYQLLKSMDHMHRNGIFHRDIKPENILIADDHLKLADFGSCRGIYSKQPYTEYISTRWYRAPECLLTDGYYNYKMDLWGVGCVFFEVVALYPLFPGTNELDQVQKIHNIVGTPPPDVLERFKRHASHMEFNFPAKEGSGIAKLLPHASQDCVDLICKLLAYNPEDRISARQALRHPYFKEIRDMEKRQRKASEQASSTLNDTASVGGSSTISAHTRTGTKKPSNTWKSDVSVASHGSNHSNTGGFKGVLGGGRHGNEESSSGRQHVYQHVQGVAGGGHATGHHGHSHNEGHFPAIGGRAAGGSSLRPAMEAKGVSAYKSYTKKHARRKAPREYGSSVGANGGSSLAGGSRLSEAYGGVSAISGHKAGLPRNRGLRR